MKSIRYRLFAAVLVTAAFFSALDAAWIPLKAEAAQWLMARAWHQTLAGDPDARPWPWADTRPVAELSIPRLGLRQWVLEGASGRNLAFGPTALTDIMAADLVLSAHRDTHFRGLGMLAAGDRIALHTREGVREYRVTGSDIVDSRFHRLVLDPFTERLTLVTCYPFDALEAGGPLRYVVTALPAGPPG